MCAYIFLGRKKERKKKMAGFEDSILTVLVMIGFGVGALIISKADSKKKRRHRKESRR